MIKILLLSLLLSFSVQASKCVQLSSEFIKSGREIELFHFPESNFNHASIQAEYRSIEVGFINYSDHGANSLYIDLVRTDYNFRMEGVQTALINRLIKLESPNRISLSFGETNKEIFLYNMFDELFSHIVDVGYKPKLAEVYMVENIDMINVKLLRRAIFKTPTGKALFNAGFTKVKTVLSTYPVKGSTNVSIHMMFRKGE